MKSLKWEQDPDHPECVTVSVPLAAERSVSFLLDPSLVTKIAREAYPKLEMEINLPSHHISETFICDFGRLRYVRSGHVEDRRAEDSGDEIIENDFIEESESGVYAISRGSAYEVAGKWLGKEGWTREPEYYSISLFPEIIPAMLMDNESQGPLFSESEKHDKLETDSPDSIAPFEKPEEISSKDTGKPLEIVKEPAEKKETTKTTSGKINVFVKDRSTSKPVPGAGVILYYNEEIIDAATDASGIALFDDSGDIPETIWIALSAKGYKDFSGALEKSEWMEIAITKKTETIEEKPVTKPAENVVKAEAPREDGIPGKKPDVKKISGKDSSQPPPLPQKKKLGERKKKKSPPTIEKRNHMLIRFIDKSRERPIVSKRVYIDCLGIKEVYFTDSRGEIHFNRENLPEYFDMRISASGFRYKADTFVYQKAMTIRLSKKWTVKNIIALGILFFLMLFFYRACFPDRKKADTWEPDSETSVPLPPEENEGSEIPTAPMEKTEKPYRHEYPQSGVKQNFPEKEVNAVHRSESPSMEKNREPARIPQVQKKEKSIRVIEEITPKPYPEEEKLPPKTEPDRKNETADCTPEEKALGLCGGKDGCTPEKRALGLCD